ncbi:MAG: BRO family protein [Candidatus Diapherotrites archaeon]|nr:BRO family protein [Candidatus Diapherotrites archaeon]
MFVIQVKFIEETNALVVFQGAKIRRTWHNEEWWFSIFDIVSALIDSKDPEQYIKKMRNRDQPLNSNWGTICTPLELLALDGRKRQVNCVNTAGAFRIIQSIPSPKAEPFKLWLSKVGYERIQEIENPELSQERMKELFKAKGYSDEWIEKRARGISVRQELTDEWKKRNINENKEFAILTNEISQATFGKTVEEYKKFKNLKQQNLRDHMNDLELIFTMLGEASTTKIARSKNAQGFNQNKKAAKLGGQIAGSARKKLEIESGEKITTQENYLEEPETKKRKKIK